MRPANSSYPSRIDKEKKVCYNKNKRPNKSQIEKGGCLMKLWKHRVLSLVCLLILVSLLSSCSALLHAHTYRYEYDEEKHWKVCAECGETLGEEAHHTLTLKESVEATCEHSGYILYECTACDFTRTEVTPALAHQFETIPGSDTRVWCRAYLEKHRHTGGDSSPLPADSERCKPSQIVSVYHSSFCQLVTGAA